MITVILVLQLVIIIFLILFYIKQRNSVSDKKEQEEIKKELDRSLAILNNNLSNQLSNKSSETLVALKNISDSLDKKVSIQNVEQTNALKNTIFTLENKLNTQSEQNSKYIKEVIERVTSLDNIKEQVLNLNNNITSLESILNDKKARGTFGEVRLKQIFEAVFGEGQNKIYEEQYMLSNGKRVDFILHGPYPLNDLPIDSKFPLENYLNVINAQTEEETKIAKREFKKDLKKHINDISDKYIIENETSSQAIMFIPSEAIFAHINAYDEDVVRYSYEKKVWLASPSTFMAILNLLLIVIKDIKRNDSYLEIFSEVNKLKVEFERFDTRWKTLIKDVEKVTRDVSEVDITSNKIVKRFNDIEKVEINEDSEGIDENNSK